MLLNAHISFLPLLVQHRPSFAVQSEVCTRRLTHQSDSVLLVHTKSSGNRPFVGQTEVEVMRLSRSAKLELAGELYTVWMRDTTDSADVSTAHFIAFSILNDIEYTMDTLFNGVYKYLDYVRVNVSTQTDKVNNVESQPNRKPRVWRLFRARC